jgi:sugar phosphate isomerase/epimerase
LLSKDFEGGVRRVAEMGYAGVEPAGFPGSTPEKAAKLFKELGLQVCSAHSAMPIGDKKQEVLDTMRTLGCTRIVSGMGPDDFKTVEKIKVSCDRFNQASAAAVENGLTFGIHNHWWEFDKVEGRYAYQIAQEFLAPEVFFEVDCYWAKTAGADPAKAVRELKARAPLLHIKDGPCVKGAPMTAVGEGTVDFHAVAKAGKKYTQWMIVELDSCATDMMEAVKKSLDYLVREGLGHGRAR